MKKKALAVMLACNSGLLMADEATSAVVTEQAVEAVDTPVTELEPLQIRATATNDPITKKDYVAPNAVSATRSDTPIHDTPVAVQVIPRVIMDDQQVVQVKDAVKNVSGVMPAPYQFYDGYVIRGFDTGSNVYRNGLRQNSFGDQQTANVEQVEVLKGPAAVLYGRIEPGGLVNVVTKKPLAQPYYSIQQQVGSWDFYRTTADATGPITDDGSLLYRVNLAYQKNHSFVDYLDNKNIFITPMLTWRPSDNFELNLEFEYQRKEYVHYGTNGGGVPAIGNRPADVRRSLYVGNPSISVNHPNEQNRNYTGFDWKFDFNDNWSLKHRFGYTDVDYETHYAGAASGSTAFNETTGVLKQTLQGAFQDRKAYATNLDLTGKFNTGEIQHNVLLGVDYLRLKQNYYGLGLSGINIALPSIDIFNPVYPNSEAILNSTPDNSFFVRKEYWTGVYFQDQMAFAEKWHLLLGGRFDDANHGTGSDYRVGGNLNTAWSKLAMRHDSAFSPRVGLLYQPMPWMSIYGNYVESFGANNGVDAAGKAHDPQEGKQKEIGVKTEMFDGKVTATAALFEITKTNLLTRDPNNLAVTIPIGEARSRGIELDITGKISEKWSLIASASIDSAEITKDNSVVNREGKSLPGVPLRSGSVWAKYDNGSETEGLSFGAGLYLRGQREGDPNNTYQLPGYGRVDAFAAYKFKALGAKVATAQVNVNNLFDKKYFEYGGSGGTRFNIYYGEPISIMGSLKLEY